MKEGWFLICLLLSSCGGGGAAPSTEQAAPFRQAVEAYVKTQGMEMRPDAFATLAIVGNTATAEVQMAARDVAYGLRPRWTFHFTKKGGQWQVTEVKR